jgi:arylformamidase
MLYDISRTISPDTAVWPGDTPFSSELVMAMAGGDSVNVTTLKLSVHTGAHIDAPYHFTEDGLRVGQVPLDVFLGPARVVSVNKTGGLLPADLEGHALTGVERVLFHTPASDVPDEQWSDEFAHMTVEMADRLAGLGVKLVGLDSPSMDPFDSQDMPAHHALNRHGIAILENLSLKGVPDGDYELIALPLKLADADASPVRAVLRTLVD